MLDTLRTAAGTWIAKLLLSLLVVSFAVWGIAGKMAGVHGGHTLVTVGGTTVSVTEYRLAYDRQINVLAQRFGQRLTREQAKALGVENQVLTQLISGAVLDEQARKLGLGLSRDRIATLTWDDQAFHGPDGKFDRQRFEAVLRQVGMKPADYFANRSQAAVRQQIVEAVSDGLKAPDTFYRAVALYRGENRTAEYLVLPKSLVEPIETPSDAALSTWFDERKNDYAAPEFRKISYVRLTPEDIVDETVVTDEQVRADYEKNKDSFTTPETRAIEQLVFASNEAAESALTKLKTGTSFDQLIADEKKTQADVQLGTLSKANVPDAAVAESAFALPANGVSDVVQGSFGPVLLRVTAITPRVVKAFEEVSGDIRRDLALDQARREVLNVHDAYEDARAGGSTLAEAADKLKLKVTTVDAISHAAQRPDDSVVDDLPSSSALLNAAFESEVGVENDAVSVGPEGYVFFEVEGITAARGRTLDEVRPKALAAWTAAETTKRLSDKATELQKRLKDGTTLDALATELSLDKQTKRGLKRDADDADFGADGVVAVFGAPKDGVGIVTGQDDSRILFKVAEIFEPAASGPEAVPEDAQKDFSTGLADDLLGQLVARLETDFPVSVDQSVMSQALAF